MNIYLILIAGTAGMCLLAGGIIAFTLIYKKRLAENKVKHQKELLQSTITAQEKERKRLAADLHDEVGSMLAALRLNLSALQHITQPAERNYRLNEVRQLLDLTSASARRISHDLMPPALETFGLPAAALDLFNSLESVGLSIQIDFSPYATTGAADADLSVFRVLQELVSNTIKHANASRIQVTASRSGEGLTIQYLDNGKGFNANLWSGKGIGLRNIESRISAFGGSINFNTVSTGFSISLFIPVQ